jgi:hypothetical protein
MLGNTSLGLNAEPMQRHWSKQELETYWSFSSDELTLIPDRDASSRLGVAASLKFLQLEGFFPSSVKDIPVISVSRVCFVRMLPPYDAVLQQPESADDNTLPGVMREIVFSHTIYFYIL